MSRRARAAARLLVLLIAGVVLFAFYPRAVAFLELAAREIRYLWWLILLLALAAWLIWGVGRRPR